MKTTGIEIEGNFYIILSSSQRTFTETLKAGVLIDKMYPLLNRKDDINDEIVFN